MSTVGAKRARGKCVLIGHTFWPDPAKLLPLSRFFGSKMQCKARGPTRRFNEAWSSASNFKLKSLAPSVPSFSPEPLPPPLQQSSSSSPIFQSARNTRGMLLWRLMPTILGSAVGAPSLVARSTTLYLARKVSPAFPSSPLFLIRIYSFFLFAIYTIQFRHFRRRFEFSELKPYNNLLRSASRRCVPLFIFNHCST